MTTTTSKGTLTRREREKVAHRREILEAAERVFAEKGFDHATVEEIAREAEFSVGALYNFFKNREDLWSEVRAKIGKDFLDAFRKETAAADDPLKAITALIQLRLRYVKEHGAFLRVFTETQSGTPVVPAAALPRSSHSTYYYTYIDEAALLFEGAMAKGQLRKADATYTVLSMEGAISAFRTYWARRDVALSVSEQADLVHRHVLAPLVIRKGKKERNDNDTRGK